MKERTNEQWLAELGGPNPDEALADLYDLLVRGLRAAFGSYGGGVEANFGDFAQEALIRITGNLDSFPGESRFTTWAQKIAMNVALTELKRRRWRDVSLQDLFAQREAADRRASEHPANPRTAGVPEHGAGGVAPDGRRGTDRQATRGGRGGDTGGDAHLGGRQAHGHQPERPLQAAARCPQKAEEADGGCWPLGK